MEAPQSKVDVKPQLAVTTGRTNNATATTTITTAATSKNVPVNNAKPLITSNTNSALPKPLPSSVAANTPLLANPIGNRNFNRPIGGQSLPNQVKPAQEKSPQPLMQVTKNNQSTDTFNQNPKSGNNAPFSSNQAPRKYNQVDNSTKAEVPSPKKEKDDNQNNKNTGDVNTNNPGMAGTQFNQSNRQNQIQSNANQNRFGNQSRFGVANEQASNQQNAKFGNQGSGQIVNRLGPQGQNQGITGNNKAPSNQHDIQNTDQQHSHYNRGDNHSTGRGGQVRGGNNDEYNNSRFGGNQGGPNRGGNANPRDRSFDRNNKVRQGPGSHGNSSQNDGRPSGPANRDYRREGGRGRGGYNQVSSPVNRGIGNRILI